MVIELKRSLALPPQFATAVKPGKTEHPWGSLGLNAGLCSFTIRPWNKSVMLYCTSKNEVDNAIERVPISMSHAVVESFELANPRIQVRPEAGIY